MGLLPDPHRCSYHVGDRIPGLGGILPDGSVTWPGWRPLRILLRGEEGSGKTTFAISWACLARTQARSPDYYSPRQEAEGRRCVLYYVVDNFPERVLEKVDAFGLAKGRQGVKVWPGEFVTRCDGGRSAVSGIVASQEFASCCAGTHLFVVNYTGRRRLADLTELIRQDVNSVSCVGECAVVIDPVSALEWHGGKLEFVDSELASDDWPGIPRPAVVFLLDEASADVQARPTREPYVADVFIRLWQGGEREVEREGYCERYLQVVKVANTRHARGPQLFRISDGKGLEVLPSLASHVARLEKCAGREDGNRTVRIGIPGLDDEIGGGQKGFVNRGSSTLLVGPQGALKTPLALKFCMEGLREKRGRGKSVFLSLHERPSVLREFARKLGCRLRDNAICCRDSADSFDFSHISNEHRLVLHRISSAFMPPEGFLIMVTRILNAMGLRSCQEAHGLGSRCAEATGAPVRFVVDAVSDLDMNFPRLTGKKAFLSALVNTLHAYGATSLFVFNESSHESRDDRVIETLVDNALRLYKRPIGGAVHTLLHVEEIENRFPSHQYVFELTSRKSERRERLEARLATERYCVDQNGELSPAGIALFLDASNEAHEEFNKAICDACGVPSDALDHALVQEHIDSYRKILDSLADRRDRAIIASVDLAYLSDDIKRRFMPLDRYLATGEGGPPTESDFVNISGASRRVKPLQCTRCDGKIRVLPSFVDCSLVLCNLDILSNSPIGGALGRVEKSIREQLERPVDARTVLPEIDVRVFIKAAQEFWQSENFTRDSRRFFGFSFEPHMNAEPLICMFLEWLRCREALPKDMTTVFESPDELPDRWRMPLEEFARFYLPPVSVPAPAEATPANCLFFQTWHSVVYSQGVTRCLPVRIGPSWMSTRGGWCWGIVDNGMGGQTAFEVLRYAMSESMNLRRIDRHIGIPPRHSFCCDTGELSIYNLGLMRHIVETQSWSRAAVPGYSRISQHLYALFYQYLTFLQRMRFVSTETNAHAIHRWLTTALNQTAEALRGLR